MSRNDIIIKNKNSMYRLNGMSEHNWKGFLNWKVELKK